MLVDSLASESLTGRRALVTGAGRGLGRALAIGLAGRGVDVALVARTGDEVDQAAAETASHGVESVALRCDLAAPSERDALIDRLLNDGRGYDIVINNAATVEPVGPTRRQPFDAYRQALEVNVFSPIALTMAFVGHMLEQSWGRVVNVSSAALNDPASMVHGNAYLTSKAALDMHSLNLAEELRDTGVTVNLYRPGIMDTEMQARLRTGDPGEIGAMRQRFVDVHRRGDLVDPLFSARRLLERIAGPETGSTWTVDDETATAPS